MNYINVDLLKQKMYYEAFEKDSDLQKWESGCWIRYKLFENVLDQISIEDVKPVIHGEWVYNGSLNEYVCSNCKLEHSPIKRNYCATCGAKMEKGKSIYGS